MTLRLRRIVSDGSSGVNIAGLDVGHQLGLQVGGWRPSGTLHDSSRSVARPCNYYQLAEAGDPSDYRGAAWRNVADADAVLLVTRGGGDQRDRFIATCCGDPRHQRPLLHVDLAERIPVARERIRIAPFEPGTAPWYLEVLWWLQRGEFQILNVAGTRESNGLGIYHQTRTLLLAALAWKPREVDDDGGHDGGTGDLPDGS